MEIMKVDDTSPIDRSMWHGAMRSIQIRICKEFKVSYIDLLSSRRDKQAVEPRHLAMWLCRKLTMASLPQIGRAFHDRHHTTIMNAIEKIEHRLKHDVYFSAQVNAIVKELYDEH